MKIIGTLAMLLTTASVNAATLLDESFNGPGPVAPGLVITGGSIVGEGDPEFLDGNALWFGADGTRSIVTPSFDLSAGGAISFALKYGGPNGTTWFEDMDQADNEYVTFSASVNNGASWFGVEYFGMYDTGSEDKWGYRQASYGAHPVYSNIIFRITQTSHNGASQDTWAIDNLKVVNYAVETVPVPAALWLFGSGLAVVLGRFKVTRSASTAGRGPRAG